MCTVCSPFDLQECSGPALGGEAAMLLIPVSAKIWRKWMKMAHISILTKWHQQHVHHIPWKPRATASSPIGRIFISDQAGDHW